MQAVGKRKFINGLSILRAMTTPSSVLMRIPNWLSDEVSLRMGEKLSMIKMTPQKIWQCGSDAGVLWKHYGLAKKFVSENKYLYAPIKKYIYRWLGRPVPELFDVNLGLNHMKFDFIWSNLELSQASFEELIPKWKKHLAPNALLMFSYLGPDTGKNLHRLLGLEKITHYLSPDMHDVGDALLQAGFSEPVMDMEYVTLDYESLDLLLKDALLLGLIDHEEANLVRNQVSRQKNEEQLQMTLELVYGHAWTPELNLSKTKDGLATISLDQIVRSKK